MLLLPTPAQRSHAEKDALIAALTARLVLADERIAAQDARIAALEARLSHQTRPPKTPGNSSRPPSQGHKPDLPAPGAGRPPRQSRPGVGRTLHPNPDRTIDRRLTTCPKCQAVFPDASQTLQQVYERIELPPVRPDVTQVRLFGGRCACCGDRVTAAAPAGLQPGSPFGETIAASLRAAPAPKRDLPQGDQRLPLRVGGGNLCRLPLGSLSTAKGKPRFGPRYPSGSCCQPSDPGRPGPGRGEQLPRFCTRICLKFQSSDFGTREKNWVAFARPAVIFDHFDLNGSHRPTCPR